MQVKASALLKGLSTYIPGIRALACRSSGGTVSARYCYSVWLRHLAKAYEDGLPVVPRRLAELGPGDSFGIGTAGILSGVEEYYALDVKPHAQAWRNVQVLQELTELFLERAPIPDDEEFPLVYPRLGSYEFPRHMLTEGVLRSSLRPSRLAVIEEALAHGATGSHEVRVSYVAPWMGSANIPPDSLDMVISQAVLEHVEDIGETYRALFKWLRPGGFMSHTIDYRAHDYTRDWYGHWTLPDFMWLVVRGRRPYFINRHPHSRHVTSMREAGFHIVNEDKRTATPISRESLAAGFSWLSDEDLRTSGAFIQAVRE